MTQDTDTGVVLVREGRPAAVTKSPTHQGLHSHSSPVPRPAWKGRGTPAPAPQGPQRPGWSSVSSWQGRGRRPENSRRSRGHAWTHVPSGLTVARCVSRRERAVSSSCHSRHETWGQGSEKSGCPGCSGVQVVPPASAGMKQKGSGVGEDSGRGCCGWRHCGTQEEASRGPVCTQPTQRPWQSWSECQPVRAEWTGPPQELLLLLAQASRGESPRGHKQSLRLCQGRKAVGFPGELRPPYPTPHHSGLSLGALACVRGGGGHRWSPGTDGDKESTR